MSLQALRHRPEWPGTAGQPHGTLDTSARPPGQLFEPRAFGHEPELPGTTGRPQVPWIQERDAGDSWLTLRALGPRAESPGKAAQPHGPSDQVPNLPAELIGTTGTRTGVRISQDSLSTPSEVIHVQESPGISG